MTDKPMLLQNGHLEKEVRELFLAKLDVKVPAQETDLLRTGLVDSVRMAALVLSLETRFGIELPFDSLEIDDFRTVPRIAALVARSLSAV